MKPSVHGGAACLSSFAHLESGPRYWAENFPKRPVSAPAVYLTISRGDTSVP